LLVGIIIVLCKFVARQTNRDSDYGTNGTWQGFDREEGGELNAMVKEFSSEFEVGKR
jgi:hypothetical protein